MKDAPLSINLWFVAGDRPFEQSNFALLRWAALSFAAHAAVGLVVLNQFNLPQLDVEGGLVPVRLTGTQFEVEFESDERASPPAPSVPSGGGIPKVPEADPATAPLHAPADPQAPVAPSPPPAPTAPTVGPAQDQPRDGSVLPGGDQGLRAAPPKDDFTASNPAPSESEDESDASSNDDPFDRLPLPAASGAGVQSSAPPTPPGSRSPAGSYGEEGDPGAASSLRRAFVKTLPLAAKLDPTWQTIEDGDLGSLIVGLELGPQGQLERVLNQSGSAHPALFRAAQKNRVFLAAGRFLVDEGKHGRTLLVRLGGRVTHRAPSTDHAQDKVVALGVRVDPDDRRAEPTGAYFTLGSGLHVEFTVAPMDR